MIRKPTKIKNITAKKIADSRNPYLRMQRHGYIVFANREGVRITTDADYEHKRIESVSLTAQAIAKRGAENSNDRIVDQMAGITPSHLLQRIKRVLK